MNEPFLWMSHPLHTNEPLAMSHIWMRHFYEWVMSHIWICHVTHINESCHTHEWVMSHIWMCHVTHMNESCHTHECVTSHIWMSHVTHMNESCHTYEWVMSRIWMRRIAHEPNQLTYTNVKLMGRLAASKLTFWVMSHMGLSHVTPADESSCM